MPAENIINNNVNKETKLVALNVNETIIDENGLKHELKLLNSRIENGRQIQDFRLKVTGSHNYFSEVDYTVISFNNGKRTLKINWYNIAATPSYVPVKTGISLHKFSGSTYNMDFWKTPANAKPGVTTVNKSFNIDNNWTVQVEARTVRAVGNPGLPGTSYFPKTVVRNH